MLRRKKKTYKKIIATLFLLGFVCYLLNSVFFLHVHTLADGTKIVHAHPYHKNKEVPGRQHHHSSLELMLIGQTRVFLNNVNSVEIAVRQCERFVFNEQLVTNYTLEIFSDFGQRAPPFFVV